MEPGVGGMSTPHCPLGKCQSGILLVSSSQKQSRSYSITQIKAKLNSKLKLAQVCFPGFSEGDRALDLETTTSSVLNPSNVGRSGDAPVRISARQAAFGAWGHYPGRIHLAASRHQTFLHCSLIT